MARCWVSYGAYLSNKSSDYIDILKSQSSDSSCDFTHAYDSPYQQTIMLYITHSYCIMAGLYEWRPKLITNVASQPTRGITAWWKLCGGKQEEGMHRRSI